MEKLTRELNTVSFICFGFVYQSLLGKQSEKKSALVQGLYMICCINYFNLSMFQNAWFIHDLICFLKL